MPRPTWTTELSAVLSGARVNGAACLVSVTGSTRAGSQVAGSAADDLKQLHLELGGNASALVFDGADVAATAAGVAAKNTEKRG